MVLSCAIHLDRDPPVYSPGDVIEGVLVISSSWTDKLSGISVKLAKKLEVNWDVNKLYDRNHVGSVDDVSFVSQCEILDSPKTNGRRPPSPCSSTSLSNFASKRGIIITRGVTHRYPFLLNVSYELDLPSSFRGTYGYVAYRLVAFIKSPKKGFFIGSTKEIGIFPILDLNHLDVALQQGADEKRIFKSLFGYNYVFMKAHMDKKAFLPEESVHFTVEVTNKSPATLDGVEVHLNMSTHFSIQGSSKIESRNLLRIRGPCITQGEHGIWCHSFTFPPALPTGLGVHSRSRSKYIDLQYTLTFSLEVSKAEKFSIPFPIVIGTVPFGRKVCIHHLHMHPDDPQPPQPVSLTGIPGGVGGGSTAATSSSSREYLHRRLSDEEYGYSDAEAGPGPSRRRRGGGGGGGGVAVRPRSKSTSSLPPSYSSTNLHYHTSSLRKAETPPPTYSEARGMTPLLLSP